MANVESLKPIVEEMIIRLIDTEELKDGLLAQTEDAEKERVNNLYNLANSTSLASAKNQPHGISRGLIKKHTSNKNFTMAINLIKEHAILNFTAKETLSFYVSLLENIDEESPREIVEMVLKKISILIYYEKFEINKLNDMFFKTAIKYKAFEILEKSYENCDSNEQKLSFIKKMIIFSENSRAFEMNRYKSTNKRDG